MMQLRLALGLVLCACGGQRTEAEAPAKKLSAEDEVLQIASVWQALEEEHGARGSASPVATYRAKRKSVLTFRAGNKDGEELFELAEHFEMKNGALFECRTRGKTRVGVRFGRRRGSPALEVVRPPVVLRRDCRPPDFPELEVALAGGSSRYALTDERLVAFQPLDEKREYLPSE
jgi:hypothetical protein